MASCVVTALNLVALSEHFELGLTVESFDLSLVLGEFSSHGQLSHIPFMHVAELGD